MPAAAAATTAWAPTTGSSPSADGYLELLAVADAEEAAGSALGRAVTERLAGVGEGLMGWAVATDDVSAVAARLGTELVEIRRQGFVGRLTGVPEAMAEPCLPFFIERGRDVPAPGAGRRRGRPPVGRGGRRRGAARRLARRRGLQVRVQPGPPALLAVGIGEQRLP